MNGVNVDVSQNIGPRTLLRGFLILETVAASVEGIGVSEIALKTELDKGTVSRVLAALRELGYVHQRPDDRRYVLGSRSLWLAHRYHLNSEEIVNVARPHLRQLRDITNENVHLAIMEGISLVFVAKEEPDRAVQVKPVLGIQLPLEQTAMGRAILSSMSPERRERLLVQLHSSAAARGEEINLDELRSDVEKASERGWAAIDRHDDVTRMATSILDIRNEPIAALTLSGPSYRIDPKVQEYSDLLLKTAKTITKNISL